MKKLLIKFTFITMFIRGYSQCTYFEDSTTLRTIGNVSATLCNSNFTYCSKNGYGLYPHTNYRVLNLMINIIYDVNPCLDPLYNNCNPPSAGAWNPGTPNSINTNPPNYLTAFMDQDFNTLPYVGAMTLKTLR
ncbi:MAG TPA: hypothetical protein PKN75_15290 [Bacteroidia bacterium]|nr:hypothetical protein [Bacteroidia bacterium]